MSKKVLLMMLLMAVFAPWVANAQETVVIGDGTNATIANPIGTYYNYSITEQLYTAEEIGMSGIISGIGFYYAGTIAKDFPINVYMKNVDVADLSEGISFQGAVQVFSGTLSVRSAGWASIQLEIPFTYDGSMNLLIGVEKDYVGWYSGGAWYSTAAENMARYSQNDNNAYDFNTTPGSINPNRPNIRIDITPINVYQLTVNDGTTTNGIVPIYGYWADNISKSQFIIPADDLAAMQWGTIDKLTFYANNASVTWDNAQFEVYMTETTETTLSAFADFGTMVKVKNAANLSISDNKMVVPLDIPYPYSGGNLMIGFLQTTSGTYSTSNWYGVSATYGTSWGGYGNNISAQSFLPKTTIDYEHSGPPACLKPNQLTVNYTGGSTAEVSWTSDAPAWNMRVNGHNVPGIITNPYTLTNLHIATTYNVEVRAICGDGTTSDWVSTSFTTDYCPPDYMCELTYVLNDSYGDGWNGNAIQVVDTETGVVLATLTLTSGSTATGTLPVCYGRNIQFVWIKGSYPGESSWVIYDAYGEEITSGTGTIDMYTGDVLADYTMSCFISNCKRPTHLAVTEVSGYTAVVSWTENGEATEWVVEYTDVNAGSVYTMETTSNPYTLVGLFPESDYTVRVRPVCSDFDDKWSEEIGFVTDVACPAPTNLNATHVTTNKATLTWEGSGEQYIVRYCALPHGEVYAEQNFENNSMGEWTTIDADSDGYDWELGSTSMGYGCGHNASNNLALSQSYDEVLCIPLTPDNYLVSPQVTLGGSITFWACSQDDSYWAFEHFGVAVSTTGNTDPANFTTIWETTMTAKSRGNANCLSLEGSKMNRSMTRSGNRDQGTWYRYTVDLSDYSGLGYVAIRHFNCTNMYSLDVDDIVIEGAPQMNWTERPVTNNTVTISGLEPETEYIWQVQAVCGGDDGSSVWSGTSTFTTGSFCDAPVELEATNITFNHAELNWFGNQRKYNVRYRTAAHQTIYFTDDFDETHQESNWTQNDGVFSHWIGTNDWFVLLGNVGDDTGGTGAPQYLISPELGGEYEEGTLLCFDYIRFGPNSNMVFRVGYSTTTADVEAFTWGNEIMLLLDQWVEFEEVIPAGTKYFAIQTKDSYVDENLGVDNFRVLAPVVEPGNWIVFNNRTSPLSISISPETQYEWQVQGIYRGCNNNNATEWSEASYFMSEAMPSQTVTLVRGTNWFSTYLNIQLGQLLYALETALPNTKIVIKSQLAGTLTYYRGRWVGDLETLDVTQMYMIQVPADCEFTLSASLLIPAEHPITITKGWNWIGFPCNHSVSVEEALSNFTPRNNDIIKGKNSYTKFINGTWQGSLNTFEPGQGYMYKSVSYSNKTLVFNTGDRGDAINGDITPENNFFQPANDYANNMSLTAVVELDGKEMRSEDYELAAFVGDECRGSVKLMYVEPIDRYVAFLTVFGDYEEELHFRLTDGIATSLSTDRLTYAVDGILGELDNPVVLHFGPMDVEENTLADVKIYPNPSEGVFNIEGQNIRKVEVFNSLGQLVYAKGTENGLMMIDLTNHAAGIYLVRVVTDNGIWNHQVMKR